MRAKTFLALATLLLLAASAAFHPIAQGRPAPAAPAILLYTGGLFGQLEPCG